MDSSDIEEALGDDSLSELSDFVFSGSEYLPSSDNNSDDSGDALSDINDNEQFESVADGDAISDLTLVNHSVENESDPIIIVIPGQIETAPSSSTQQPQRTKPNQFLTDEIIDHIVKETNRYAHQHLSSVQLKRRSMMRQWIDCSTEEIKTLFGIFMIMGNQAEDEKLKETMTNSPAITTLNDSVNDIVQSSSALNHNDKPDICAHCPDNDDTPLWNEALGNNDQQSSNTTTLNDSVNDIVQSSSALNYNDKPDICAPCPDNDDTPLWNEALRNNDQQSSNTTTLNDSVNDIVQSSSALNHNDKPDICAPCPDNDDTPLWNEALGNNDQQSSNTTTLNDSVNDIVQSSSALNYNDKPDICAPCPDNDDTPLWNEALGNNDQQSSNTTLNDSVNDIVQSSSALNYNDKPDICAPCPDNDDTPLWNEALGNNDQQSSNTTLNDSVNDIVQSSSALNYNDNLIFVPLVLIMTILLCGMALGNNDQQSDDMVKSSSALNYNDKPDICACPDSDDTPLWNSETMTNSPTIQL
ncbi:hypothetical protein J6590_103655 [Homalodisca vitripennis]|nr:hypothetical protein J6590_103655 [Homalodisca vitripennis]